MEGLLFIISSIPFELKLGIKACIEIHGPCIFILWVIIRTVPDWNNLPAHIVYSDSLQTFKFRLCK